MVLSNNDLIRIIKSFNSVNYYETFEFLLDYISLDDHIAGDLFSSVLLFLRTPITKQQQNSQFEIIKKLIKYPIVKNVLNGHFFNYVIKSLNVQLVDLVITELDIQINEIFHGLIVLQWVVLYIISNTNIDFAYEMFYYLLSNGADINKKNESGFNIFYYIEMIRDASIEDKLYGMIKNQKTRKNLLIKEQKQNTKNKLNEMINDRIKRKLLLIKETQKSKEFEKKQSKTTKNKLKCKLKTLSTHQLTKEQTQSIKSKNDKQKVERKERKIISYKTTENNPKYIPKPPSIYQTKGQTQTIKLKKDEQKVENKILLPKITTITQIYTKTSK